MKTKELKEIWNKNAESWTSLSRSGFDLFRDHFNTPAFFEMLPSIKGLKGVDIGCGEGYNSRFLAKEGASLTAVDISDVFIKHAEEEEKNTPSGITYMVADARELPFNDMTFDFATAFMSFMDMPDIKRVLSEIYRVLKSGAFLQFSIAHPCFNTLNVRNIRDKNGVTYAKEISDYFIPANGEIWEWTFSSIPPEIAGKTEKFKVPAFTYTISSWLNLLIDAGFIIERLEEPQPTDSAVKNYPLLTVAEKIACFLHVRVRKPAV